MRQVIAGSGGLAVPSEALTQRALRWCYATPVPSLGWIERDGLGVAFRRTPTGLDAAGRPGAFFVHALVWRSGSLPPGLLASLAEAGIWVTAPPDDPPPVLPALRSADDLRISPLPEPSRDELLGVLAAHLANVAAGRGSYMSLEPTTAFQHAAHIANMLPRSFELPGFSTYEEPKRAGDYDILVGEEPPAPSFARIAPDGRADRFWRIAAGLLVDAMRGDPSAAAVVDVMSGRASTLREFAPVLRRWAVLDDPRATEPVDPNAVADAAAEPRLLGRLLAGPRAAEVARAVAAGRRHREIAAAARLTGRREFLLELIGRELAMRRPGAAVAGLVNTDDAFGQAAAVTVAQLTTAWHGDGRLDALTPEEAASLLRLLVAAGVPKVGATLAALPGNAPHVLADPTMPAVWRGAAAAAHPSGVMHKRLVQQLVTSSGFAEGFVGAATASSFAALQSAFRAVPSATAYEALQRLDPFLTEQERTRLGFPVLLRLEPRTRLDALLSYAPATADDAAVWCDAALDAYVDIVMTTRARVDELPPIGSLRLPPHTSSRAAAFTSVGLELRPESGGMLRAGACGRAAEAAVTMLAGEDSDAALEAIVDAAADGFPQARGQWFAAMRDVHGTTGEDPVLFAERLARAGWRMGVRDRSSTARWTILWIAIALHRRELDRGDIAGLPFDRLHRRLRSADIEVLEELAQEAPRGPARRWLKDVGRTLEHRYEQR